MDTQLLEFLTHVQTRTIKPGVSGKLVDCTNIAKMTEFVQNNFAPIPASSVNSKYEPDGVAKGLGYALTEEPQGDLNQAVVFRRSGSLLTQDKAKSGILFHNIDMGDGTFAQVELSDKGSDEFYYTYKTTDAPQPVAFN